MTVFDLTVPSVVERVRARNHELCAFVRTRFDDAIRDAAARAAERPRSALHGVPHSLEDNWDTAGIPTTGGSHRFRERIAALWDRGYFVVAPVSTTPAPEHGRSFSCTVPANVADATALSIPSGRFSDGLPRAFQILGPPGSEELVLDFAALVQAPQ